MDINKIRMAYIESELAKRYRHGAPGDLSGLDGATLSKTNNPLSTSELPEREPASLGKLHEIDLGQEAKLRNIARTEEATKRMNGDDDELLNERPSSKMPPRYRKRQTSEDIERDRLVEEVLRESKRKYFLNPQARTLLRFALNLCLSLTSTNFVVDVYDEPGEEEVPADDQAADDRVAEQFRRDFLDAIQSRRRVARIKPTKQPGKAEGPKGPKLGGSRSARAAMREMQEKGTRK